MEINNYMQQNISSIRHALSIATLKKTLNQDAQTIDILLQGFRDTNSKVMESSVTPHKGGSIDISV